MKKYVTESGLKRFLSKLVHKANTEENPVVLYEAENAEGHWPVELSDDVSNYYMIDIEWGAIDYGQGLSSVRVYNPDGKSFRADGNWVNYEYSPARLYNIHAVWHINGNVISLDGNEDTQAILADGSGGWSCGPGQTYIAKVVGYRHTAPNFALSVYPVGSVYISVNNINPSELFGGEWEAFATGRTLVGIDSSQTEFDTVEKEGGEKEHTLSVNEMPSHEHYVRERNSLSGASADYWTGVQANGFSGDYPHYKLTTTQLNYTWPFSGYQGLIATASGGSQAHNNLQPYITVYMWKRIG